MNLSSKVFQKELLEFQQKQSELLLHHLHKRDGVVIGDVVGLGKTITACALANCLKKISFWKL
jgi:signal recognition particle GTPase